MNDDDEARQDMEWESLCAKIRHLLQAYGTENQYGEADYLLVDDNYGWRRHTIEIHTLKMLQPVIVDALQKLLDDLEDWEIVIAVDVPGTETAWPRMGVTIRKHEIIDGLQRQYLPAAYKDVAYPGSRPGTGYD